eukprot:gnl/MRDRNA2_/MRDRNA2_106702_c0_seq1.p1 gnl/MRDRNA2_/MRDRNA2_106702_c0~~gnl/MRDRNA2_/MRDRNA2_106702_c0_seq1.p1  ORF type:complete len:353 (+),score=74.02 gnl/MRDRNA2_/MRDRNA2_106702_c0_seq1:61-1119(+)
MKLFVLCLTLPVGLAWSARFFAPVNGSAINFQSEAPAAVTPTFVGWYDVYQTGKGIWKWKNALEAYQLHFARFQNSKVALVEIGVQSGGSIKMFTDVLGANCHYYGCDINPKCTNFANQVATITIMDQGNAQQWVNFYSTVVSAVDIIVDDGGHQPYQMLITLQQSFAHVNPGGVHLVEDIHGMNGDYNAGFFSPAADFLGALSGQVASVHLYPFILVVQKAGGTYVAPAPATAAATYSTLESLFTALPNHRGSVVHLKNDAWPPLLSADGMKAVFAAFYDLHGGKVQPYPPQCFDDAVKYPECTMYVANTALNSLVSKVDIFMGHAEITVAPEAPKIYASRKGTEWIPYSE